MKKKDEKQNDKLDRNDKIAKSKKINKSRLNFYSLIFYYIVPRMGLEPIRSQ